MTLSLTVSVSASIAETTVGLPTGVALAWRFPGRGVLIGGANAFLGLPPVVVGLVLYLLQHAARLQAIHVQGNVLDLAVAVVMGAAFGPVVTALVKDLITPLIAAIIGKPDFAAIDSP